jgi:hypothetical protein
MAHAALMDGSEAVAGTGWDRTTATLVVPAQRDTVWMVRCGEGRVPEHVIKRLVDAGHPAAEPVGGGREHTFDSLGKASDGKVTPPGLVRRWRRLVPPRGSGLLAPQLRHASRWCARLPLRGCADRVLELAQASAERTKGPSVLS